MNKLSKKVPSPNRVECRALKEMPALENFLGKFHF